MFFFALFLSPSSISYFNHYIMMKIGLRDASGLDCDQFESKHLLYIQEYYWEDVARHWRHHYIQSHTLHYYTIYSQLFFVWLLLFLAVNFENAHKISFQFYECIDFYRLVFHSLETMHYVIIFLPIWFMLIYFNLFFILLFCLI